MDKADAAIALAYRASDAQFDDISGSEVHATKLSILDTLGVLLAATTLEDSSRRTVEFAKEVGGTGKSTILGFGGKLPAAMAAFANGALVHGVDFDDVRDFASGVHPTAATLPPTLALMEECQALTGKQLITAITVGSDIVCRLGLANPKAFGRSLTAPMTMGIFGAAASSGRVLGLSKEQMVSCLGFALAQASASTLTFHEGDCDLRMIYPAFTAKAGVIAALMAQKGLKGGRHSLEGRGGFCDAILRGDYDPRPLTIGHGDGYEGANVSLKAYPSCRKIHRYIDATRLLAKKHAIRPADVARVVARVGTFGMTLCTPEETRRNPKQPSDAKFSIPYCLATCLVYGGVGLSNFMPDALRNPQVLELAKKVDWQFDPEFDALSGTESEYAEVSIHCMNGDVHSEKITAALGSQLNPMSVDDVISKFHDCAALSIKPLQKENIEHVVDLCLNLEEVPDIRKIIQLIS